MDYIISFLEGIITFISPCILPMLPLYIAYFLGGSSSKQKVLKNSIGFVLGFTIVFVSLGALSSSVGVLLQQHTTLVNIVTGSIVILFGLNFLGLINIKFINNHQNNIKANTKDLGFLSSLAFGIIFSISFSPCTGVFLGSALMLAANSESVIHGSLMLLTYSLGLGIPFILSALLIDNLKSVFDFIKKHYTIINKVCGILLVIIGLIIMTNNMSILINIFA